jgi:hypothetical protein
MRVALFAFYTIVLSCITSTSASAQDPRVVYLKAKILEKMPDSRWTRDALGETVEREARATEHAESIIKAADRYIEEWEVFVTDAGWVEFEPKRDLPALITGIAYHESSFRSVVRLDDDTLVKKAPKFGRADMGVLQVRAPSTVAANCGVMDKIDVQRLVDDLPFAYMTGTCILTKRVAAYINRYKSQAFKRFRRTERSNHDLEFYGFGTKHKNTEHYRLARELVVVERYNWGDKDLYLNDLHGGYARRVISLFEFFRIPVHDCGA